MSEISIIIPVYNKEQYVEVCLESIKKQSFTDYECIIIDDGSSDQSGNICDRISERDTRFKCIHITNQGVSHARNIGIDIASGKYITFIDSDDYIDEVYLENLHRCITENNVDIVISGYRKVWDGIEGIEEHILPIEPGIYLWKNLIDSFAYIQKTTGVYGCCTSKMLKKNLIENIVFDEKLCLAEDFDFYLRVYPKCNTVYVDDKSYYEYRQKTMNSSFLIDDNKIDYYSQLNINIRYKNFMISMNGYNGVNKKIIDDNICNYIYFTIYHSDSNDLRKYINQISKNISTENIKNCSMNLRKKTIFFMTKHRLYNTTRFILSGKKIIKRILKR